MAPTSSPTPSNSGGGGGSHAGAIAGGIVGGIAGLLLLIGAFIYFRRRAKYHSVQPHSVASPGTPLSPSPGNYLFYTAHLLTVSPLTHFL